MLKTKREQRRRYLISKGFLPFEARALSRSPIKIVPYFKALIADRASEYAEWMADKDKGGHTYWQIHLIKRYKDNGWMKSDRKGRRIGDPWQMFRAAEDKFKAKNPTYDSPWEKRPRTRKDFVEKMERTIRKQGGT